MKINLHYLFIMMSKLLLYGIFFQCFFLTFLKAEEGNAQRKSLDHTFIKIDKKIWPLNEIINEIEKNTEFHFVYPEEYLVTTANINLEPKKTSLKNILLATSRDTGLKFQQINKSIFIGKDEVEIKSIIEENAPQLITVRGKVTSAEEPQGLPGVNILIKNTTQGTVTDINGEYRIEVPNNESILVFSSIGFVNEEIVVGNRNVINLTMVPDIQALSEVVVVGYGTQKKVTATGSIATLKGADIVQAPVINASNALAGRMAGLVAVTRSGEPGNDGATLRIRGLNTLGDNNPLIVVDGIPGRSLDRIDPNSIESITVLKDASAAIYGAQAANGVILITTKRGTIGKPEISVNLNQGFGRPTVLPEMANAATYATMLNEIDMYRGDNPRFTQDEITKFQDGSDPWRYPDTDWFSEVLRPWSGQNYFNATISGGTENIKYFLLAGYRDQQGFYKNSAANYDQIDFRSNIDGKISDNVTIGFDISGRQENRNYPTRSSGAIFRMVMRGKPHMHAFWPDGTPGPDIEYGDNPAVISTDATGYDRDRRYILNNNLRLDIKIPWVEGLTINSNAGIDKEFHHRKIFATPWFLYSWDYQSYDNNGNPVLNRGQRGFNDARLTQSMADRQDILLNTFVNYERTLADVHAFKIMAGAERRTGNYENFNAFRRFFVSTAVDQMFAGGEQDMNTGGSAGQSARLNYFGRVNYNFMEKYLAEFVWRYDGSYIFPEDRRYGFFPGISLGWRISEEDFWKNNITFIDNFKLRGSWGQTGNDRIDEFQYFAAYNFGRWDRRDWSSQYFINQPYVFGVDQENKAMYEQFIPNRNVTWEVATQRNLGIEMSMLDGKIFFEADYFNNIRSEILWWRNASVPGSTGLSLPRENIGKVGNRGFDFNLGYNDQAGEFKYQISLNGGYAKNEILFWDEAPGAPDYQLSTGSPMFTNLYYNSLGIFRTQEEIDAYPSWSGARPGDIKFEDVNGDGVIDANDRVRNQFNNIPRFTGGLNLNMQFRNFDLTILFQGAAGAVQYISTESGEIGNYLQSFAENRWTPENPNASGPRTFNRGNEYWMNNGNTHFLHRTDYIRLKNLQVGYNLPATLTERIGMQGLRFYVGGFNLLTYAPDFKDFDPEMTNAAGTAYPLQKIVNGGLTLTF